MAEEVRVALLEQKLHDMNKIILKLDDTIDKLSEVNSNVIKMLAVHEERISKQEEADTVLFTKIDKLRDKIDIDYNNMLSRIQKIEKRIWIAMGVFYAFNFYQSNPKILNGILTSHSETPIIRYRNFKA